MTATTTPMVVMGVSDAADVLGMSRSNVAKFMALHGYTPIATRVGRGQLWRESDVLEAKAERERDEGKLQADQRRRDAARGLRPTPRPKEKATPSVRLGETQRQVLRLLPATLDEVVSKSGGALTENVARHALRRLLVRGLVAIKLPDGRYEAVTSPGKRSE